MNQQLLFAAILAGFSGGVLIAWFASRRQIETYRKETAFLLNARDDILEYVNTLSLLVPEAKARGLRNTDVVKLQELVDSIKGQLRDLQKRVDCIEVKETALERERPRELDHTSPRSGRELALSTRSGAESKRRETDPREQRRPANANTNDAEPITGFSQKLLDLASGESQSKFIGSFPMEPLSTRRVESHSAQRSAGRSGPIWEPISAEELSLPQPPYSPGTSDRDARSASWPTGADP